MSRESSEASDRMSQRSEASDRVSKLSLPDSVTLNCSFALIIVGLCLFGCGLGGLLQHVLFDECTIESLLVGLVLLVFQFYIVASEANPKVYNFFAVFIPDILFMAEFFGVTLRLFRRLVDRIHSNLHVLGLDAEGRPEILDNTSFIGILVLAFYFCGWVTLLVRVVLLGIELTRYRRRRYASRSNTRNPQSSLEDNLEAPEMVENSVENGETSSNDDFDGARESVHYNPTDPYHPLRMHPVAAAATIKSVAPDFLASQVPAIESEKLHPTPLIAISPPVYNPLPSRSYSNSAEPAA